MSNLVAREVKSPSPVSNSADAAWCVAQCAGAPSAPSLSRRVASTETAPGVAASALLDAATKEGLERAAAALAVSLPQLLCALWIAFLSRMTRQSDILIGYEVGSRREPDAPSNLMPLRVTVAPGQTLAELAFRVRRGARQAFRHRRFAHAELRRVLGLWPGDLEPLAVSFGFGERREQRERATTSGRDIGFTVEPRNDGLLLRLEANGTRYGRAETESLLARLVLAASRVAAAEDIVPMVVADVAIMDAAELQTVTDVFPLGPPSPPPDTLAGLFAAQVARTPDADALLAGSDRLTYTELDAESNRLARELLARGFGPGDVAVLLLPRTARLIVGLLACVKAGIVYCPLDPTNPRERLEYMTSASGAKLVLRELPGPVELGAGLATLRLDDPRVQAAVARKSASALADWECRPLTPRDLAYIIFTSGSTGRPKGVLVSNGAIAQQVQAVAREVPMTTGDAALALFTIAFDVATLDIFLTLTQGASLVLLDEQESRDPDLIVSAVLRHHAVTVNATPTLWRTLNIEMLPAGLTAMCGGEQFPPDLLPRLSRLRAVLNLYGPTETTVTATLQRVHPDDLRDGIIPVGRPLAGYRVWIVDADDRPVPIGGIGELCIGGWALAEGYVGDPSLTALRFVPSPFGEGRMYRTGDLARWRPDGAVEILGRSDAQVKIHGHRIELGEIEQAIRSLPWAADAAVVPMASGNMTRLIAYVVARPGQTAPGNGRLRTALADRLPEVMRPSSVVVLPVLPRMPSGKLDRSSLPLPVDDSPRDLLPPQSPEEALLRFGFARVTGRAEVAGDDDFFEIGGDSLRAMILVSEMRQAHFNLPMELLFSARTPAAIVASWRASRTSRLASDQRPLVFMLPGAGGDHPGLAKLRANCADAIQFVPLEYPDWPRFAHRNASMDDIAKSLVARIEQIAPPGPVLLAGYSFGAYVAWRIGELFLEKGRPIQGLIFLDAEATIVTPPPRVPSPVIPRLVRLAGLLFEAWKNNEFSQALAENLSWHLTHGRGLQLLRTLTWFRRLPLPKAFRTWLRFYVSRELHALVVFPWYPVWRNGRDASARYPVVLLRATEPAEGRSEDLGWREFFADLRITAVTGDHLTMLDYVGPGSLRDSFPAAIGELVPSDAQRTDETVTATIPE